MKEKIKKNKYLLFLFFSLFLLIYCSYLIPLKKSDKINYELISGFYEIDFNSSLNYNFTTDYETLNRIDFVSKTNFDYIKTLRIQEIQFNQYKEFNYLNTNINTLGLKKMNSYIYIEQKKDIYNTVSVNNEPHFIINIFDDAGNSIVSNYSVRFANANQFLKLQFDEIKNVKWKQLHMNIACNNCNEFKGYIGINNSDKYAMSTNYRNKNIDTGITYDIYGRNHNYNYLPIAILLFIVSLVLYINDIFKIPLNNLLSKIKIITYSFVQIVLSIILSLCLYKLVVNCMYYDKLLLKYLILLILSASMLLMMIIKRLNNDKYKLENIYLSIAIPISIILIFMILPFWISDEDQHYYKMYTVSENVFKTVNDNIVPTITVENNMENINKYSDYENVIAKKTNYDNTISVQSRSNSYNSIMYILPSFGIKIARLLNLNFYVGFYLARIINMLFMVIFGYYIIKIIPFGKMTMTIFLLNPMYIHQGISLSVDCFTNSFCILLISYILKLKEQNNSISKKQYFILLSIMCAISITKYVYTPIVLFSLLILKNKNNNNKINFKIVFYIMISFLIAVSLFIITNRALSIGTQTIDSSNLGMSYATSTIDILKKPLDYVNILYNTILNNGCEYLETLFGSKLGWLSINVNRIMVYLYLMIFIICAINDEFKLSKKDKLFSIIIAIITINLIFLAFYLSYIDTSQKIIFGVQGRYFIPIVPLLMFTIMNNKQYFAKNRFSLFCFKMILFIYIFYVMAVINSFV